MEKLLLRPREAADLMGISGASAYKLIADGTLPSIKLGGTLRVPVEELKAWIAKRITPAPDPD